MHVPLSTVDPFRLSAAMPTVNGNGGSQQPNVR